MLIDALQFDGSDNIFPQLIYIFLHIQIIHLIIIFPMSLEFEAMMATAYPSYLYWPTPYNYQIWYQALSPQYQPSYIHPQHYIVYYEASIKKIQDQNKPKKLSRNQKRAIKKHALMEQLESQKKKIGDWVRLQRKDLINGLQKIEQQQKKKKNKKKQKFSHLIEIHKQVYKHHIKKGGQNENITKRVNKTNKKKRMSFIKKMKYLYEKNNNLKKQDNISQDQWQNQSQQQKQQAKQSVEKKTKQIQKLQALDYKSIEKIKYVQLGKLAGKKHQNITLRQWVRNVPTQKLQDICLKLVNRLAYKQAVRKVQKPTKAKKLVVSGIKQCIRTLQTILDKNRSRSLIVALNIQRNPLKKGIDDEVQAAISTAIKLNIPIIHTSTRSKLGRAFTGKFGPRITMVSIINYEGYQDMMEQLINEWKNCCDKYDLL